MQDPQDPLDLFCLLAEKPGMFVHTTRFDAVWSFMEGFNSARDEHPLQGFREWLLLQRGSWSNLAWFMLIRERVFPDTDPGALPQPHEHAPLLRELRRALVDFRAARDSVGVEAILRDYQPLWDAVRTR